jgi:hypothetical protein
VNLAELGTEGNIEDYREIQLDGPQRDALHEFHWLPMRHGALLKTLPVHEPNDLYDTTFRLFTLQSLFRMGKTQRSIDLLSDERGARRIGTRFGSTVPVSATLETRCGHSLVPAFRSGTFRHGQPVRGGEPWARARIPASGIPYRTDIRAPT